MELLEALQNRRSIRHFTDQPISPEDVRHLLTCANLAPSANNGHPWEFLIVTDPKKLAQLAETNKNWIPAKNCTLCIIVAANLTDYPCSHVDYYMQDCAACTQNLLLSAHERGLGAVWMGCCPAEDRMEAVRKLFDIPDEIMPFSVVALGYPAEHPHRDIVLSEQIIHWETWT